MNSVEKTFNKGLEIDIISSLENNDTLVQHHGMSEHRYTSEFITVIMMDRWKECCDGY